MRFYPNPIPKAMQKSMIFHGPKAFSICSGSGGNAKIEAVIV